MQLRGTIGPLSFEKIAVSDNKVSRPSYEPLECLTVPVQPGQHVYIRTRNTGMWSEDTTCTLVQQATLLLRSSAASDDNNHHLDKLAFKHWRRASTCDEMGSEQLFSLV